MTYSEWLVLLGGVATIVLINWYFGLVGLPSRRRESPRPSPGPDSEEGSK